MRTKNSLDMSLRLASFTRICGKQFFLSNAIHLQCQPLKSSIFTSFNTQILPRIATKYKLFPTYKSPLRSFSQTSAVKNIWRDIFSGSKNRYSRLNRFQQYTYPKNNNLRGLTLWGVTFMAGSFILMPFIFQIPPFVYFKSHPTYLPYFILGLNCAIFGLWQAPRFWVILQRYALLSKDHIYSKWSLIGSAFSHQEFWHLGMNMVCLYSFGTSLVTILGPETFTSLYLNSAIMGSLFSLWYPKIARLMMMGPSLGASGALFGLLGSFSYLIPNAKIMFFVFPLPFGAWISFLGLASWNILGCIFRWGSFDYAAHLGGSAMGIFYGWLVSQKIKKEKERRLAFFSRF